MKYLFSTLQLELVAGVRRLVAVSGTGLTVKGSSAPVDIDFLEVTGNVIGSAVGAEAGDALSDLTPGFSGIVVVSAVTQTITIVVSSGAFAVNRIAGAVSILGGSAHGLPKVGLVAGVTSPIVDTSGRREIMLQADAANTEPVWIGSTVADTGIKLPPGGLFVLSAAGTVDLFCAAAAIVYILEVS